MHVQTLKRIGRAFIIISIGFMSILLFSYLFKLIYPMLIACLFAFLLHPLITFLHERLRIPRIASTCIVVGVLCVSIFWLVFFVITEIIQGTTYLAENLPTHILFFTQYVDQFFQHQIVPLYEKFTALFSRLPMIHQQTIEENIHAFLDHTTHTIISFIQHVFQGIPAVLSVFPQSVAMIGFICIATFLLAIDFDTYIGRVKQLFSERFQTYSYHVFSHVKTAFFGYVKAQMKLVLLTCFLLYIGLVIIDIKHAFTIVVFAMIADFLPYVGTGILFVPWILYLFIIGQYELTIKLSILYAIVVIVRQIMEPKFVSAHLNLRPLTALFALFIGFQIWGVIGMLLAPMVLIFLVGVYQAGTFHLIWKYIMDDQPTDDK